MDVFPSRESILKNIRKALTQPSSIPFKEIEKMEHSFVQPAEDLAVIFAQKFTSLLGKFSFCENEEELVSKINELISSQQWNEVYCNDENIRTAFNSFGFNRFSEKELSDSDASITLCEFLVARTGSMVLSSKVSSGRTTSVYAPIHICIAKTSQLVYDIKDALDLLKKKYGDNMPSQISFATGPSRTADIEKTLVVGVHGPKEVYCFLIDA